MSNTLMLTTTQGPILRAHSVHVFYLLPNGILFEWTFNHRNGYQILSAAQQLLPRWGKVRLNCTSKDKRWQMTQRTNLRWPLAMKASTLGAANAAASNKAPTPKPATSFAVMLSISWKSAFDSLCNQFPSSCGLRWRERITEWRIQSASVIRNTWPNKLQLRNRDGRSWADWSKCVCVCGWTAQEWAGTVT